MNTFFNRLVKKLFSSSKITQKPPVVKKLSKQTCLHEAGHYIMAYMFQEHFKLHFITFDKAKIDPSWNGGFKFGNVPNKVLTPDFDDQFALISISGLCVDTISFHGALVVKENLHRFPNDARMLQTNGSDIDYYNFKQRVRMVSGRFGLNTIRTEWNVFLFAFEFFLKESVWQAVEEIGDLLLNSPNYTLTHDQIHEYLIQKSYYSDLICVRLQINLRYPLNFEKLKLNIN